MAADVERIRTVLVVIAMEAEALPVIERLGLQRNDPPKIPPPSPCVSYSGQVGNLNVHLVWNGRSSLYGVDYVGTVPAALATYLAIQAFQPDLVVSAGTAGGFRSQGAVIGDIFLSSSKMNHDRRIPIAGFDKYGVDHRESISTKNLQNELGFKSGKVSSGNSLDYTDKCMEIMTGHGVAIKEMEAAAIAWVACQLFGKPMFCVKSVTDIVDGDRPTNEEFLENLNLAASALCEALPLVLKFVDGKTLAEL